MIEKKIKTSSLPDTFPDGTVVEKWFYDTQMPALSQLGRQYIISDYGIYNDGQLYTQQLQQLIDKIATDGGGVLVIPKGTYNSGALFFKPKVNLYIAKDGVLKGSDDITDYPVIKTRIEGETCMYYAALINVNKVDNFTMCGEGTIDGNGLHSWKCFWQRRLWNPNCTNKDEQRARLVYISDSKNVTIAGLSMKDSQFWTNHIYKCSYVKFLNCNISSPRTPIKAPSTDAIDIDACTDILIYGCTINVNDDAIALKGGKGINADKLSDNGINERIIIHNCTYKFCHGCLTCGSESIHNKNIIMHNINIFNGYNLLWIKLRRDTQQHFEHILIDNVNGKIESFININPWTQFLQSEKMCVSPSTIEHITMQNCQCECNCYYNVKEDNTQYTLSDINLLNNSITVTSNNENAALHNDAE